MKLPPIKTDGRIRRHEYTGVGHAVDIAVSGDSRTEAGRKIGDKLSTMSTSWTGYKSARDNREADIETLATIRQIRDRIERQLDLPQQTVRRRRHGLDSGAELDPIAWVQRDPYGWTDTLREPQTKRVIRIGVNLVLSSFMGQSYVLYRGACAVALADILSSQGIDVELVAFKASSDADGAGQTDVQSVVVKASDQPLNLAACATCFCSLSFVRTVLLAGQARMCPLPPHSSMGSPTNLPEEDRKGFDVIIDQDVQTYDGAVTRVLEEVRKASGRA
jgi:hypothetical protein